MLRRFATAMSAVSAVILCVACTYGEVQTRVAVQNVALSPDGELLAAIVKFERFQAPTGLSAFPDGGQPRILGQRADVYVVNLPRHSMVFEGSLDAPENRRSSFSPWVVGWTDQRVYFQITGCPNLPGAECWGDLLGKSFYTYSPGGTIRAVPSAAGATLSSKIVAKSSFVDVSTEAYGVSIARGPGAIRSPLLEFTGEQLRLTDR